MAWDRRMKLFVSERDLCSLRVLGRVFRLNGAAEAAALSALAAKEAGNEFLRFMTKELGDGSMYDDERPMAQAARLVRETYKVVDGKLIRDLAKEGVIAERVKRKAVFRLRNELKSDLKILGYEKIRNHSGYMYVLRHYTLTG